MKTITLTIPKGLSLLDLKNKYPKKFKKFWNQDWYEKQEFAKVKTRGGKFTLMVDGAPSSTDKTWDEQQSCIPKGYIVPNVVEVVYCMIKKKEKFEKYKWFRCNQVDSDGDHVFVGIYDSRVDVGGVWDSGRDSGVAVASGKFHDLKPCNLESSSDFDSSGRMIGTNIRFGFDKKNIIKGCFIVCNDKSIFAISNPFNAEYNVFTGARWRGKRSLIDKIRTCVSLFKWLK